MTKPALQPVSDLASLMLSFLHRPATAVNLMWRIHAHPCMGSQSQEPCGAPSLLPLPTLGNSGKWESSTRQARGTSTMLCSSLGGSPTQRRPQTPCLWPILATFCDAAATVTTVSPFQAQQTCVNTLLKLKKRERERSPTHEVKAVLL